MFHNCNGKTMYLCGDFNVDLLQCENHAATGNFIDQIYSYGLHPLITRPTRITKQSAKLIDNIYNRATVSGLIINDLSDHLPVYQICDYVDNIHQQENQCFETRPINEEKLQSFINTLANMKWEVILNNEDVNFTYTKLIEIFANTCESSFPVRKLSRKTKRQHKPWMTPGLKNACKKKNVLYKRFLKARSDAAEVRYKKYKNKLTSILRYCEKQYYSNLLEESKNNTKETWKIIKSLLNKKSKKSYYPSEFKNNGSTISGNKKIAEYFNQFFVNIGPSLARTIPKCNTSFVSYLGDRVEESLFLNPVSEEQILAIVCKCKSKKSKGYDGIDMCLVKKIVPHILAPLRHYM